MGKAKCPVTLTAVKRAIEGTKKAGYEPSSVTVDINDGKVTVQIERNTEVKPDEWGNIK
jgi:hypothetical protein